MAGISASVQVLLHQGKFSLLGSLLGVQFVYLGFEPSLVFSKSLVVHPLLL